MSTQLQIEFDQENVELIRDNLSNMSQEELINALVDLYLNFIKVSKEEVENEIDK